jgi:hypothetical protein
MSDDDLINNIKSYYAQIKIIVYELKESLIKEYPLVPKEEIKNIADNMINLLINAATQPNYQLISLEELNNKINEVKAKVKNLSMVYKNN